VLWIVGGLLLAVTAGVPVWTLRARRQAIDVARAAAAASHRRLRFCVDTAGRPDDPYARQLLAGARERCRTADALLDEAATTEHLRAVERTAREGLQLVAEARRRLEALEWQ
jgi:hypothetical protein